MEKLPLFNFVIVFTFLIPVLVVLSSTIFPFSFVFFKVVGDFPTMACWFILLSAITRLLPIYVFKNTLEGVSFLEQPSPKKGHLLRK